MVLDFTWISDKGHNDIADWAVWLKVGSKLQYI